MKEVKSTGYSLTLRGREIHAECPSPMIGNIDVVPFGKRMDPEASIGDLIEGHFVLITDFYSSGLSLLNHLKHYLQDKQRGKTFREQRNFRNEYRELSHRILLEISNNSPKVKKAPHIGWLSILYPGLQDFALPFPQVQGLNSAWQWYQKGILIPVLGRKIHPWYGCYFPTRFEHLELFGQWLNKYPGNKESAYDIGTGSGVLSLQMIKNGVGKVHSTDSNPNAIISLHEQLKRDKIDEQIILHHGDLFAGSTERTDLIVFNPPWLPENYGAEGLDRAIYYEPSMFNRFFESAPGHLKPNGRIVILFSTMAQVTGLLKTHPIEEALKEHPGIQVKARLQQNVATASSRTRRKQDWRSTELVELWELTCSGKDDG